MNMPTSTFHRRAAALLLAVAAFTALAPTPRAAAGGFYFTDRGTRPAGRGFAFVAGADDPQAIIYNPAGLAYSGQQLMLDVSLTWFRGTYTRVDSGGTLLPTIDLGTVPLPIPGLAFSQPLGDDFTLGLGLTAPNALLGDYPNGIRGDGSPCDPDDDPTCGAAPQRYSLYSLNGTAIVQLDAALAWRPHPRISIGAGIGFVLGNFHAEVALSACDNAICAQRENPDFDARVSMSLENFWDVAPHVGVIVDLGRVRLGASARFYPRGIQGTAKLQVRLPPDPFFEGAAIDGDRARVQIKMPMILRLGAEVRPTDEVRIEGAFVYEGWSRQERVAISPQGVTLTNVTAIGDYAVGDIGILRDMNNTFSFRLGGEAFLLDGLLTLRAGLSFDTSSFPDRTLTPMTIDTQKAILGLGASVNVSDNLSLDIAYAHVFMQNRTVTNSEVRQANGIRPPLDGADAVYIGNGRYRWSADIFAVGLRYRFDGRTGSGTLASDASAAEPDTSPDEGDPSASEESADDSAPERGTSPDAAAESGDDDSDGTSEPSDASEVPPENAAPAPTGQPSWSTQ